MERMQYKPGQMIIRTVFPVNGEYKIGEIIKLHKVYDDASNNYFVLQDGEETTWNDKYFRPLSKLELALR